MPGLETLYQQIFRQPDFARKLLIGGALTTVPLINLLALGYLYRFAWQMQSQRSLQLPEWEDWQGLLLDGLRLALIALLYVAAPLLVAGLVTFLMVGFFGLFWLDLLAGTIAWIPFNLVLFLSPLLGLAALRRYLREPEWETLLRVRPVLRLAQRWLGRAILPLLVYWGLTFLAWPLLGWGVFAALLLLVASFGVLDTEERR